MNYEFSITASMSELVWFPDEWADEYQVHPNFKAVMDWLGISVPVSDIYERYFESPVNSGHILVFEQTSDSTSCIVLDTYRDPLDQMDVIRLGWRSKYEDREIRRISRKFYDECEFAIRYQEGQSVLSEWLREELYPRKFHYQTLFEQRIKRYVNLMESSNEDK
ncbi:hypothetical protein [Paenibacillus solani]|uniref:Uncharacterized protein n=1 Tax=Paenibacillus solani TaxID=1705565 RepID=A0A0M1P401_9BACL|nr:hypothetical protein [Paenibacillus solani]KOR89132.1 hypothetical protein AM231_08130 [Paenibacillus solani]